MVRYTHHAGGCCGVKHLHGFLEGDRECLSRAKSLLKKTTHGGNSFIGPDSIVYESNRGSKGKIIEVVLTDRQIRDLPETCAYLKGYGFKLAHRFDNSTGSMCNVLHYCCSTRPLEESPFQNVEAGDVNLAPKVGEVWKVTSTRDHGFPANCYVVILEGVDNVSFLVKRIHGDDQTLTQILTADQLLFVRERP